MALRNALGAVSTETTLSAIRTLLERVLPVSVQNWPATQPVSGTVSVGNLPTTQQVNVTNFPATQTVAGSVTANTGLAQPLTDAQLRAARVPVDTGQAQALTDAQLRAAAVPTAVQNFPATQNTDVVDRAARALGRVSIPAQTYDSNGSLVVTPRPRSTQTATLAASPAFSAVAAQIVNANPNRLSLTIANTTGVDIYIGFTSVVTSTLGVRVPAGATLSETVWTGPVWAAAGGATARTVSIQEVSAA